MLPTVSEKINKTLFKHRKRVREEEVTGTTPAFFCDTFSFPPYRYTETITGQGHEKETDKNPVEMVDSTGGGAADSLSGGVHNLV